MSLFRYHIVRCAKLGLVICLALGVEVWRLPTDIIASIRGAWFARIVDPRVNNTGLAIFAKPGLTVLIAALIAGLFIGGICGTGIAWREERMMQQSRGRKSH